jgi:hypothetical protein
LEYYLGTWFYLLTLTSFEVIMPSIIEHVDCYEYTGPSGLPVRFAKVDPPEGSGIGQKPSEILASIRASDPEAATVEKYVPKNGVSLSAFKEHMVDLEIYERAETESTKWPAKVRIQWNNGASIKLGDPLYVALSSGGITEPVLHDLLTIAEKNA